MKWQDSKKSMSSSKCSVSQKDFQLLNTSSLRDICENRNFTDVTLICNDFINFEAHKIILSSQSGFFSRILKAVEKRDLVIYLPNLSSEQFSLILEFLYFGKTEVHERDLENFLSLCKQLEIRDISDKIDYAGQAIAKEGYKDGNLAIEKCQMKRQANGKFPCDQCDYQSVYRSGVTRHQKAIHLGIKHSCDECPKEYGSLSDLRLHRNNAHEGVSYPCNLCDKVFGTRKNLMKHDREHQGIGTTCPRCEESFDSTNALWLHIKKKHGGIKYKCKLCDFGTKRKFGLKEHMFKEHP